MKNSTRKTSKKIARRAVDSWKPGKRQLASFLVTMKEKATGEIILQHIVRDVFTPSEAETVFRSENMVYADDLKTYSVKGKKLAPRFQKAA